MEKSNRLHIASELARAVCDEVGERGHFYAHDLAEPGKFSRFQEKELGDFTRFSPVRT
jgi:hypothetical protein